MESFTLEFPQLYVRARSLALRLLGDVGDAEDAAAEAMIRALKHWPRVGTLPHREAWVLRVTTNVALDVARRRRRSPVALGHDVPERASDSDTEVAALRGALVVALAALPRRQREAIVLVHLMGLSPTEVATAMHVSQSSVSAHLRRGLDRLRADFHDSPEPTVLRGALS